MGIQQIVFIRNSKIFKLLPCHWFKLRGCFLNNHYLLNKFPEHLKHKQWATNLTLSQKITHNGSPRLTTLPKPCLDPKGLIASGISRYASVRALS